jgi:hypothetical protein
MIDIVLPHKGWRRWRTSGACGGISSPAAWLMGCEATITQFVPTGECLGLTVTTASPTRPRRDTASIGLGVRQAAGQKGVRFTALLHHITILLEQSYCGLERDSAKASGRYVASLWSSKRG